MMNNRPSFEQIDYTVRPAKSIERKMIAEMIGALHVFQPINKYVYVGLGSTFFSDFVIYHKMFGICDMFSIEKEETRRQRIEFNIPFECIDVQYGETTDVLPRLNWQSPVIVWMDYDKKIDYRKQDDIIFLSQNLQSSSLLMVTVRAENRDFDEGNSPPNLVVRLQSLRDSLHNKLPDLSKHEVGNLGKGIQKILNSAISDALVQANAGKSEAERIYSRQVMFFRYADGAKMMTLGWLLLNQSDISNYQKTRIKQFPFYASGNQPYYIKPPKLTFRERKHIDQQLPGKNPTCPDVPEEDIRRYSKLYRYFPAFVEAEI